MKDDVLSMQIEQARNGDEQAIAGLIARQMPQIRSLAAKAVRPGLDFDDAVQEGIIGLFSALETFDAQKGAAFATYANVCVQNAIVSAVRAAGRSKHAPLNTSVPYTETESTPGPEAPMPRPEARHRRFRTGKTICPNRIKRLSLRRTVPDRRTGGTQ